MSDAQIFADRMLSLGLARVSEQAAIAAAKLIGSGDEKSADQAAVDAMRRQLNLLDIQGVVVIGEGERDEAPMLYIGEEVGSGNGPAVDIALDPLEGTTLTAKDMPNALAVIAMGPRGSMLHAPDVYMDKLAIGPGYPTDLVSLDMNPTERIETLAKAKGSRPEGVMVCVLERPRHQDLIPLIGSHHWEVEFYSIGSAPVIGYPQPITAQIGDSPVGAYMHGFAAISARAIPEDRHHSLQL